MAHQNDDWIPSHTGLSGHGKLRKLARLLHTSRAASIGHLHMLWYFAMQQAPDGDITHFEPDHLAEVSEWPGDGEAFLKALIECNVKPGGYGFVERTNDGRLLLHDWEEYGGKLVVARRKNAERMSNTRRAKTDMQDTVSGHENAPQEATENNDVQNMCSAHATHVHNMCDVRVEENREEKRREESVCSSPKRSLDTKTEHQSGGSYTRAQASPAEPGPPEGSTGNPPGGSRGQGRGSTAGPPSRAAPVVSGQARPVGGAAPVSALERSARQFERQVDAVIREGRLP